MPKSSSSSSSPPPTPFRSRTKSCARKCERGCCAVATYFPLAFVYSVTTWAVYVEAGIGLRSPSSGNSASWTFKPTSLLGVILYLLLNTCYTVAVFTDPGSPVRKADARADYSSLPTVEPTHDAIQSVTVSSTGTPRYCKKCQTSKPDRTHHCSTCRRCVLKMDHHCPWLATCLGLHNYKAFILFLIYNCLFCLVCFLSTALWVWTEVFEQNQYLEEFTPVNVIMLAVVSGIFGLVLTGFTGWHIYLCFRGQTTIECLEKTRYLGAMRRQVERQRQNQTAHHPRSSSQGFAETLQRAGEQIIKFHANAVPGATRVEEGEERASPALDPHPGTPFVPNSERGGGRGTPAERALRRTYSSVEQQREWDRYEEYLDDKESQKLPNAFDLGWKRNLLHLFGPKPLLWFLPVCNTTGDGWQWEISPKWRQATADIARRRQADANHAANHPNATHLRGGVGFIYEDTGDLENGNAGSGMNMQTLKRPGHLWGKAGQRREFDQVEDGDVDQYEVSSDEELEAPWRTR